MNFLNTEIEEAKLYRIGIDGEPVRTLLSTLGFEVQGGQMEMYEERYIDAVKLLNVIDEEGEQADEKYQEIMAALKAFAEEIADGTICFYEY